MPLRGKQGWSARPRSRWSSAAIECFSAVSTLASRCPPSFSRFRWVCSFVSQSASRWPGARTVARAQASSASFSKGLKGTRAMPGAEYCRAPQRPSLAQYLISPASTNASRGLIRERSTCWFQVSAIMFGRCALSCSLRNSATP